MPPNDKKLAQQPESVVQPVGKTLTWAEVEQHNGEDSLWLVVQDKVYDATAFQSRHPGGKLILQGAGRDATALFISSHPSAVKTSVLPKYYIGDVKKEPGKGNPYVWDGDFYKTLQTRVEDYFRKNKLSRQDHPQLYIKMMVVFFGFIYFYYRGFILNTSLFDKLLAGYSVSHWGISVMHDGCHGAFSKNPTICRFAAMFMDFIGASSYIWKHQHNIGHHAYTNGTQDPDASTGWPILRLSPYTRWLWYHQYQHVYAWFLYWFVSFRWQMNDINALRRGHYSQAASVPLYKITKSELIIFWLTKLGFFLWAVVIPTYFHGLVHGITGWMILNFVSSIHFALQFTVNHFEEELIFPEDGEHKETDWAKLQVLTTCNYGVGSKLAEILSGGLNYQIEHHLFPTLSHPHYAQISPIVQQTCKEFGVPYLSQPTFWDALVSHHGHLKFFGTTPTKEQASILADIEGKAKKKKEY